MIPCLEHEWHLNLTWSTVDKDVDAELDYIITGHQEELQVKITRNCFKLQ
jgi:hypothetical protein